YHCVRLTMTYGNENMDVIRAGMELVREANERERAHRALLNDEIRQLHADTHSLYAEGTQATDRQ
ncbi:MAG: hypothetical protein KC548_06770, partial [Nanoarchaeota archaeon]|nr:hypothetical protein [Nanoarchaeota archaeon]